MISIFNGKRHRLGKERESEVFVQVEVALRDNLRHFKPAEFMVFMAIALRIDEDGECFPSYDQLQEDTGLHRATIAKAIKGLTELTIEGNHVLEIRRNRSERGLLVGNNIYHVFPDSSVLRTSISQNVHAVALEEEPYVKEEPKRKKNNGVTEPAAAAELNETTEGALMAALSKLNKSIKQKGGNPITGVPVLAKRLHERGVTVEDMRAAWTACKSNADKPVGAFVKWVNEGWVPPSKNGHETRIEGDKSMIWIDGQGWVATGSHT